MSEDRAPQSAKTRETTRRKRMAVDRLPHSNERAEPVSLPLELSNPAPQRRGENSPNTEESPVVDQKAGSGQEPALREKRE